MPAVVGGSIAVATNSKEQVFVSIPVVPRRLSPRRRLLTSVTVACASLAVCCLLLLTSAAQGAPRTPAWALTTSAAPTNFVPGSASGAVSSGDQSFGRLPVYTFVATNTGAAVTRGEITFTATLAAGVTPTAARIDGYYLDTTLPPCDISGQTVTCATSNPLHPGQWIRISVGVAVALDAPSSVTSQATVDGGGAATPVSTSDTTIVSTTPAAFDFLAGPAGLRTAIAETDGSAATQAGSHPYQLTIENGFSNVNPNGQDGLLTGAGPLRDLSVKLPEGMIVNPAATPVLCTESQLETNELLGGGCPAASQVGIVTTLSVFAGTTPVSVPLFNMVPPPGAPAALAFDAISLQIYVHLIGGVDAAGNYALTADSNDILARAGNPIIGIQTQLWGNPSDVSHDAMRSNSCTNHLPPATFCPVPRGNTPFLTMPSACSGPLTTTARATSWREPGIVHTRTAQTVDAHGTPVGVTGCSLLEFDPSLTLRPDVSVADSPSGLHVELKVPQNDDRRSLATSTLKDVVVRLPAGMSLSPSAADGLTACSPAQIGMGSNAKPACPESSKIGSVEIDTPLLADPLKGSVYVAAQNDNPAGSVLGIYVVAEGPGVVIKLFGSVHADPATGRLTTRFADNPQLPFSSFKLDFFGGSRAALATPESCGTFATETALSPWSGGPAAAPGDSFSISSGCGGGFAPSFAAGLENPSAGESGAFMLRVSRSDGEQHIRSVTTRLPQGLLAKVGSVPLCSNADAAAGSCPAASQVGTTDSAAGPGSNPFHIAGKVFLTGPYKGGPYGLSIVVPAKAGPFDLGTVVVRAAINVDPIDAHVTVVSDDVPNILDVKGGDGNTDGFPLRIRSIAVDVNRPGFMVTPTSCDPMSVSGLLGSWEGGSASVSSRFQVGGCSSLALSPKLAIALSGKGQTTDGKHPAVAAVVSQTPGQANLKKVRVALPLSLALDPDNANGLCEFADGSKVEPTCPKASIVGTATAVTPILNEPVSGPVYFVKNIRKDAKSGREIRTLPKLVIPLTGPNGLKLTLTGTSNVEDNQLVTTFDNIPDAPVSSFKLNVNGGKGGILTVSGADICKATQVADQQVDGQNGKHADTDIYIQTPSCPLKILSKKVGKTSVAVKVGGLGAGKVTITGKGIKKTTKTISKSTVATITAKRTKGKPGKVKVSFVAAGAKKARAVTAALR